jgi:hypothetical protein
MEPRIRDFIETKDGLIFSVVSYYHPSDRYLAFLRYYPSEDGEREFRGRRYKKVPSTGDSFRFLQENFPDHIFYSEVTKSGLQCVPVESVSKIYYPWRRLGEILGKPRSPYEKKVAKLSEIFAEIPKGKKGITGSALVGLHRETSDIDFVIYGTENHQRAREILREAIGSGVARELSHEEWMSAYKKRFPKGKILSLDEFLWHEKRKFHKGVIDGTIFDILLVRDYEEITEKYSDKKFNRRGKVTVTCAVRDSSFAFDSPALYQVHCRNQIKEVASYTHTYAGQAFRGEKIEVRGYLEEVEGKENYQRIVVGTTREAEGEYIKVIE